MIERVSANLKAYSAKDVVIELVSMDFGFTIKDTRVAQSYQMYEMSR
jgi:hypothetical protein